MSYPAITRIINERALDLETAPEADLRDALYAAFQADLGEGLQCLLTDIDEFKRTGQPYSCTRDPKSKEGQQIIRLLGADIPRSILEEKYGVSLGLYNCCKSLVGNAGTKLQMTARDQIRYQDPALADC